MRIEKTYSRNARSKQPLPCLVQVGSMDRVALTHAVRVDGSAQFLRQIGGTGVAPWTPVPLQSSLPVVHVRPQFRDLARLAAWVGAVSVLSSCAGETLATSDDALTSSSWTPSATARKAGASVRVKYEGAPPWKGTAGCGGHLTVGAKKIGEYLLGQFDQISSVGGYACRPNTANASQTSVHGTGRALDIFIPTIQGRADSDAGDPVGNWLIENAQRIGIQFIVWNRTKWRANGTNTSPYGGPNPHVDHLHVEMTSEAGNAKTPWFTDAAPKDPAGEPPVKNEPPVTSPGTAPTDEAVPSDTDDAEPGETNSLGPGPRRRPPAETPAACAVVVLVTDSLSAFVPVVLFGAAFAMLAQRRRRRSA
jgi:hypothetical protein